MSRTPATQAFRAPMAVGQPDRRKQLLRRLLALSESRRDLLSFTQFTMPDFSDPEDVTRSRYQIADHHRVIAEALHLLLSGKTKRLIINAPPRHGKTELATKRFISFYAGLNPEKSLIFGTYSGSYAQDNGRAVREIIQSPQFRQLFPDYQLDRGSEAADRLKSTMGGQLTFAGRGGPITGRGGHGIVIDDPIKNREEADSPTIRDKLWAWYTNDVASRQMDDDAWILIIQTRWHEDDLVGRLLDPSNPYYNPDEAKQWTVIDLPALALENDPLGRKPGEALWPERFGVQFLENQRRTDARAFQSLYQGKPTTDKGTFFQAEWLHEYGPADLPQDLKYYCASDFAVSTKQGRDKTALVPVGVDAHDNIYVMPDVWWMNSSADVVVEEMIRRIKKYKPIYWWAENGQISKSLGPFLRKRMGEEKAYAAIIGVVPNADKQTRAQSIQGRIAMGKVFFPKFATWWPDARDQLLKFPLGANDDFVDALAYIGLGLDTVVAPHSATKPSSNSPAFGTLGWVREQTRRAERQRASERDAAGF